MTQATNKNRRIEHGQTIQFNPRTTHRDRIGPVAARGPASILARRYGVSTKTIAQWKDDFIAAGTSGLAAGKRQAVDNAKQLAALESAVAERDRVIGELTIANVILKKNGAVLPSMTVFARD